MAQIIQHKRGVLEDLNGVTPNVGELLVVTGSSISALADGLVFVGNSSSDITAVNRILTGSSTPDVTGGDYNNFVDGVPFYNTTDKKLEILAKGGNTNVAFTTNSLDLNGSGIVSSSAQVSSLAGTSNDEITIAVGGGLNIAEADNSFTLNQTGAQTITINTGASGILSGSVGVGSVVTDAAFAQGADSIVFFDATDSSIRRDSVSDFLTAIAGDNLTVSSNQLVANAGDITGVTAGTGLSGGGDSGAVTLNFDGKGTGVLSGSLADNLKGTGVVSGSDQISSSLFGDVSGDINIDSSGTATIQANSVALSTDTTGNYVQSLVAGELIDLQNGGASEGGTPTIDVDLTEATEASIANGDYIVFLDGGATGTHAKESIADVATLFAGNGLTATNSVIAVDYGTSANTALEGNTTIDDVSVANLKTALAAGFGSNAAQIGDSNDIITIGNDLIVTGDLTVNGDTVQTNVSTLNVEDNIINLNFGGSARYSGIYAGDATGTTTSGSLVWDGQNDYWIAGASGSEARVILQGGSVGTANRVSKFDAAGTIVNSTITDDGTDVTISGELTVSGLANNSFVVTNGSAQLLEVTPSTAGDIIQWNGSSFVASNTIDGGSF